jgi:hypothetical protein
MVFEAREREGGPVEEGWFERLSTVMAGMAAGDVAALEAFYVGFADPIRSLIRKELGRLGVTSIDPARWMGWRSTCAANCSAEPARGTHPTA